MKQSELDEIKARCEAATPGPWKLKPGGPEALDDHPDNIKALKPNFSYGGLSSVLVGPPYRYSGGGSIRQKDAEFIAAARTDIPRLVAEVEQLQEDILVAYEKLRHWLRGDKSDELTPAAAADVLRDSLKKDEKSP